MNFFNLNTSALLTVERNYHIRSINAYCLQLLRLPRELVLNKSFFDFVPIHSKATLERNLKTLFENKKEQICDIELLQKGGHRKYVSVKCVHLEDDLILLHLTDITYVRQLESQTIQLNNALDSIKNILHNVTDAIATIDKDFYFKTVNASFIKLFSKIFTTKIHAGMNFLTAISDFGEEYKHQIAKNCEQALTGEATTILIENSSVLNECYFCYELKFNPIYKSEEQKNDIILLLKDLTEYKAQKNLKLKQQAELTNATRAYSVSEMTTALAHEINQPLTAILLYSQNCLLRIKKETDQTPLCQHLLALLNHISLQAEHAGAIVHRMKNFIRQGVHYPEETNINLLIKEALSFLDYELSYSHVKINLNLDEDLPKVKVDKTQLMQVIINLAKNSIEALQSTRHAFPELAFKTILNDDHIIVHCHDNGPGIPAEYIDKILNSYFTTKLQGTGLGLAICRTLIEAHGGKLHIQQHNEQGAWITFTLPVS